MARRGQPRDPSQLTANEAVMRPRCSDQLSGRHLSLECPRGSSLAAGSCSVTLWLPSLARPTRDVTSAGHGPREGRQGSSSSRAQRRSRVSA